MGKRKRIFTLIEEFKIFKSGRGTYKVSNKGYVISLKKKGEVILKHSNNGKGYMYVNLGAGFHNRYYIHRLIAMLFIANPINLKEINHKDGNKNNNQVENLEWCTRLENIKHSVSTGLCKVRGKSNLAKKVYSIQGEIFDCIRDASEHYGINYGTLKDALSTKSIYKGLSYNKIKL